jgi:hypothetical protein
MIHPEYKKHIFKFLEKYLFIFKAAADGWRVKYHTKNNISLYNNINSIKKNKNDHLLEPHNFINYYRCKISI